MVLHSKANKKTTEKQKQNPKTTKPTRNLSLVNTAVDSGALLPTLPPYLQPGCAPRE